MGLFASCSAVVLSAALLQLLFSSTALCDCPRPDLPPHSSLKGGGPEDTYPTGTLLRLQCIPGYETIPGIIPRMTCHDTKWSYLPTLCQGKRCPVPNIENGRILSSNDLRLGEEVTFGCNHGFRIIEGTTRQCVLNSGTVQWNREPPTCESIPCARPPVIANGRYEPDPSDAYEVGRIVIYQCDPNYSLIGNSTITCAVAENGVDGKWDLPSPECKKVNCPRPSIPYGNVANVFQATYTYQDNLQIECNPGYSLLGSSSIRCGADSQWKPSLPRCDKIPTTSKPTKSPTPAVPSTPPIPPRPGTVPPKEDDTEGGCPRPDLPPHSSLKGEGGPEDTYPTGTILRLQCIPGYETIPGIIPRMTCHNTKWSYLPTLCQGKRCPVPNIENGRILSSNDLRLGEEVTFGCSYGFRIIGGTTRQCVLNSGTVQWNRELPTCERKLTLILLLLKITV